MQVLQRRAWVDPELLDEHAAGVMVDLQRLRLATGAVEREHQLPAQALA